MRNMAGTAQQSAGSPLNGVRRIEQLPNLQAVGSSGGNEYGKARVGVLSRLQPAESGYPDPDLLRGGLLTHVMLLPEPTKPFPEMASDAPKPLRFAVMSGSRRAGSHDLGRSGHPRKTTRSYLIRSGRIGD